MNIIHTTLTYSVLHNIILYTFAYTYIVYTFMYFLVNQLLIYSYCSSCVSGLEYSTNRAAPGRMNYRYRAMVYICRTGL